MTYAEQRELEALPEQIVAIEAELSELHRVMADPAFYRQEPAAIVSTNGRLQSLDRKLADAYRRWEELESVREQGR